MNTLTSDRCADHHASIMHAKRRIEELERRVELLEAKEIMCTCPDHKEPHDKKDAPAVSTAYYSEYGVGIGKPESKASPANKYSIESLHRDVDKIISDVCYKKVSMGGATDDIMHLFYSYLELKDEDKITIDRKIASKWSDKYGMTEGLTPVTGAMLKEVRKSLGAERGEK